MVENEIIAELLRIVKEEASRLGQKQQISLQEYLEDWEYQHIVERSFQQAIQACIDIGARVIAQEDFRAAADYHDIFDVLFEQKLYPKEFADRLREMVGFRNALTHKYRTISHKEVYRHLQESVSIFQEFAKYILNFEESRGSNSNS